MSGGVCWRRERERERRVSGQRGARPPPPARSPTNSDATGQGDRAGPQPPARLFARCLFLQLKETGEGRKRSLACDDNYNYTVEQGVRRKGHALQGVEDGETLLMQFCPVVTRAG